MRDPERIDKILDMIRKDWKKKPDQRLGQYLGNYVFGPLRPNTMTRSSIFNIEDDEVEEQLEKVVDNEND